MYLNALPEIKDKILHTVQNKWWKKHLQVHPSHKSFTINLARFTKVIYNKDMDQIQERICVHSTHKYRSLISVLSMWDASGCKGCVGGGMGCVGDGLFNIFKDTCQLLVHGLFKVTHRLLPCGGVRPRTH
ncbi:hypothetical protein HanRHA438_Chr11g0481081 [Helianthus annuus]|nr:hypothetical protein HanRHA438_Chr11g0481081 [Helianthus annuus]